MKLLCDHCFFQAGVDLLRQSGYDVIQAKDVGLQQASDEEIAAFCQKEYRIILTLDTDFTSLYRFPLGTHKGIIFFRVTPFIPTALLDLLMPLVKREMFDFFANALVIVKKSRIKIIRPGNVTEIT